VRENILYGLEGVSEERFDRAIDAAMLKEALKGRLDMPMGEDGCNFSGGERQRVAIAQALIREPEVILLDEATTGLDNDSERGVLDAIDRIANERRPDGNRKYTIIIIAHKMRTVSSAGFIVLLDRGSVADIGPDIELYQKSSLYKDLVDLEIWNIGIQDGKGDPAKKPDRRHARVSALVG
jgi:ATP-binding cassette subfamily B protein